jgi:predicted RNA-binding protein with PUA-like domain
MAYWLFKSEPGAWSWEDQKSSTAPGEEWDGVKNYQARNNMRAMKLGDLAFFYHSIDEKRIVGIVEVTAEAHPDTTDTTGKWECVDVKAVCDVPTPVTLDEVKDVPGLEDMILINNTRLSVQPVTRAEWKIVCRMCGFKKTP